MHRRRAQLIAIAALTALAASALAGGNPFAEVYAKKSGSGYFMLGTASHQSFTEDRWFDVDLFLIEGGSYVLEYEEAGPARRAMGGTARDVLEEKVVTGDFKRDGDALVLEGVGKLSLGSGRKNGKPTATLALSSDIVTPGLEGERARLRWISTSSGPDEVDAHFD